ncbi:MAG: OmpA family protein [Gammaproteobacteria bacterium]
MSLSRNMAVAAVSLTWVAASISPADAQFGGFADKLKRKIEQRIDRTTDQQVDKTLDQAEKCITGDEACLKAQADAAAASPPAQPASPTTSAPAGTASSPAASAAVDKPGDGIWRNYDYVPGRDVWFSSDFSDDRVGRFPANLEFVKGNAEVVERNGVRMLEFKSTTSFNVNLPDKLPADFSLEVTAQTAAPNIGIDMFFSELKTSMARYPSNYLILGRDSGIYFGGSAKSAGNNLWRAATELVPFRFQADGDYAILYAGSERTANMPNATFDRTNKIHFRVHANEQRPAYIQFIQVAVGVDDLYGALEKTGNFTTRGILFAYDSDRLQPESTPTLEQLYDALNKHADLAVIIEGHTDDRGEADYNQKLSARRAAAVVDWLTGRGISSARLQSVGKGEAEPAVSNATAEGREQNRRVVIRRTS